jgi:hypothetical protein
MKFDNPEHSDHHRYLQIVNRILWIPALMIFQLLFGELLTWFFLGSFHAYAAGPFTFYWFIFIFDVFFLFTLKWELWPYWGKFWKDMIVFWHDGIVDILRGK